MPIWSSLSTGHLVAVKFLIAVAGALLLAARIRQGHQPVSNAVRRRQDLALMAIAVVAFAAWWNLGRFHFSSFTHPHEFFHYYLGAKYSPELGYAGLYDCTAAVESEESLTPELARRWTRDLRNNQLLEGSPAALDPSICRERFTKARWKEFSHDVLFFRGRVSKKKWAQMQTDHGFNATPVWTIAGKLLATTGPISSRKLTLLALIDPLILITMWMVVWWAFGWRTMAVAVIYWGTNYPARYNYIGGAFLRADWLALAVIAIALSARGWLAAGGSALGASTMLRIFPGFMAGGPALRLAGDVVRRRVNGASIASTAKVAAGAIGAVLVLVPLSWFAIDGGVQPGVARWQAFADNSRKHLSGTATNRISLKTAISYQRETRFGELRDYWLDGPGDAWQAARRSVFEQRRPLYWALVALFTGLLALAVRGQPEWIALVLGVGLIPIAADITCYYYGILLAYAFLSDRRPWIGVALCSLSAATCLAAALLDADEETYFVCSLLVVAFVFGVTAWLARYPLGAPSDAPDRAPAASTLSLSEKSRLA